MRDPRDVVIVAADFDSRARLLQFVENVGEELKRIKVGMELYAALGPGIVAELRAMGYEVFLDLKIVDIPKTMGAAARQYVGHGATMLNCMAHGGINGMRAVADVCRENGVLSVAVTVLTSQDPADCFKEHRRTPSVQVRKVYGPNAYEAGIDVLLSSPKELRGLSEVPGVCDMPKITPGIRPSWAVPAGQARFTTPAQAVRLGATYLVIGDPITNAEHGWPLDNLRRVYDEVAAVL